MKSSIILLDKGVNYIKYNVICICRSTKNLFAEESTGNLEVSPTGADTMNLLQEINQKSRQTIILVIYLPEAAKTAAGLLQ